jgi:hypothetical protein
MFDAIAALHGCAGGQDGGHIEAPPARRWASFAGRVPTTWEPMLAKPAVTLPASTALPGGTVYEPKWDGWLY